MFHDCCQRVTLAFGQRTHVSHDHHPRGPCCSRASISYDEPCMGVISYQKTFASALMMQNAPLHQVVVIGGGFGGLYAAKALRRVPVRVTLVDKRNFHLFQPLLYQVATGGVSPGDIAYPLRSVFARDANFSVIMAEVSDIDVSHRTVILRDGSLTYDTLILATGAGHQYFGHDEWAQTAPGLKTIEDALEIRRRIFLAFEMAEREPDSERRRALATFAIIGGGPTGVELAGTLGEQSPPIHLSLPRLNHRLPRGQAHPEIMQGTADFHHDIADTRLPQTDPVFDDARALDTAVDMFDAQPALGERLIRRLLLPRQLLAAWFLGRHEDLHLGERKRQEAQILQEPASSGQGIRRRVSNGLIMDATAIGPNLAKLKNLA